MESVFLTPNLMSTFCELTGPRELCCRCCVYIFECFSLSGYLLPYTALKRIVSHHSVGWLDGSSAGLFWLNAGDYNPC